MAMYYQNRMVNTPEMDKCLELIDVDSGIEMSTDWYRTSDPLDVKYKMAQSEILAEIEGSMNFDTSINRFRRSESF